MSNIYEKIFIVLYFIIVFDTIKRHGLFSLPSLFYLTLGFFQGNRLILNQLPLIQDQFGSHDYSFEAILLIISIISFKLAYEMGIKLIPSKGSEFRLTPHKKLAGLGSIIIKITLPFCFFLVIRTLLSPVLGHYGVDQVGPTVYEKSALYGAVIGIQFINSSAFPITRKTLRLFALVFIPRLILGIFTMRSLFAFFVVAQLNIWYVIGFIRKNTIRKILLLLIFLSPGLIGGTSIIRTYAVVDFSSLNLFSQLNPLFILYFASESINITQLALDNLQYMHNIFYSLSTIISIYLPFLANSDYYLESETGQGILLNRLDRSLTIALLRDRGIEYAGTGGNYLADLFLDGGFWAVGLGSCFIGFITALFVVKMKESRLFLFLGLYFSQKLLYSPRGTFTEIFDMLPIYVAIFLTGKFLSIYLIKSRLEKSEKILST
jgi:hypothetical protein